MFGMEQISWGQFMKFMLVILTVWYGAILLYTLFSQNNKIKSPFYEDTDTSEGFNHTGLQPVKVSSGSFPSGLIPYPNENIPLEVVTYEEKGEEGGYVIDEFTGSNNRALSAILKEIQYQQ